MASFGWEYLSASEREEILAGIRDGEVRGGPYHVEIHPADRCNLDCFFCSTAAIRGTDEFPLTRFGEIMQECARLGTRSVRLSGGGEPLFHRNITKILDEIEAAGLRIENLTTNGVLLTPKVVPSLLRNCDYITISLNTADRSTYGPMMQTPERNFDRVVENVRSLVDERRKAKRSRPHVNLQFLVWKENFRSIPQMYELSRSLGVDSVLFNGLAYLKPEQMMTEQETAEMLALYKQVLRVDEYRTIHPVGSFEQDLSEEMARINGELAAERAATPAPKRLWHLLRRDDFTLRQKIAHHRRMSVMRKQSRERLDLSNPCVMAWYSMLIRTTGTVAPCCILQGADLGTVMNDGVESVWKGERYTAFRNELRKTFRSDWSYVAEENEVVEPVCGVRGGCPVRSYYVQTPDFHRGLNDLDSAQA